MKVKQRCKIKNELKSSNNSCKEFIRRQPYKKESGDNIIINISGREMVCLNCKFWEQPLLNTVYPEIC